MTVTATATSLNFFLVTLKFLTLRCIRLIFFLLLCGDAFITLTVFALIRRSLHHHQIPSQKTHLHHQNRPVFYPEHQTLLVTTPFTAEKCKKFQVVFRRERKHFQYIEYGCVICGSQIVLLFTSPFGVFKS